MSCPTSAILWSAYGDKLIPKDDIDFIGTTQIALDILEYPFEMLDLFIEFSLPPYDKDKNVNLRLCHVDGLDRDTLLLKDGDNSIIPSIALFKP